MEPREVGPKGAKRSQPLEALRRHLGGTDMPMLHAVGGPASKEGQFSSLNVIEDVIHSNCRDRRTWCGLGRVGRVSRDKVLSEGPLPANRRLQTQTA